MKQRTLDGDDMTVEEFREQQNNDRSPDVDDMPTATRGPCSVCNAIAVQVAQEIDSGLCELLCHCFCHGEPQTEYVNPDVFFPPRSDDDIQEILEDDEA
jgi:hypothetical protein